VINQDTIADELQAAMDKVQQIAPFSGRIPGFDNAAGYEVARRIHEARVRAGARPVGRKIGFTNRNIWPEYGVFEPIWGYMYDSTVTHMTDGRAKCGIARFAEPRIEPEIVLHFKSTPPLTTDPAAILACIDWIAHGFEIVQSHFPHWKFRVADTMADNGLHGALLVGAPRRVEDLGADVMARLERFTITLSCNGELRERGTGANVLDGPLQAVAHLIAVLAQQRTAPRLQAGELVTTGTLTRALPMHVGETWSTTLDGIDLPGVTMTLEA